MEMVDVKRYNKSMSTFFQFVAATLLIDDGNQLSTCELHIFNMRVFFSRTTYNSMEMADVKKYNKFEYFFWFVNQNISLQIK